MSNPPDKKLTTNAGCTVVDNQNVMTAGPRGPQLLQHVWFLEKLAHFDREMIPERRMHAKGSGAHGTFTVTHDITRYTWLRQPHLQLDQREQRALLGRVPSEDAAGIRSLSDAEAEATIGECRESHPRDLFESIERRELPRWTMFVQVMPEAQAAKVPYHPFDLTKIWPHEDYPPIEVGVMELDRNPENYFAEVEQAAFNPANIVPGIGFSPDKMLQGRLFSYGDAQRYRLGVNHHLIPVNQARYPVHSYHRDGAMRVDGNHGGTLGYEPNSYGEWREQPEFAEPPLSLEGAADHWNHREDADYYSQPRALFQLMSPAQQQVLFENTARAMGDAPKEIKLRHVANCLKADPAYGKGVAEALGIEVPSVG